MQDNFGKLIVMQPGLPEREFELGKASVTLGRATTNDIILNDTRVSRNHARVECGPSGCDVVDLGSINGTRVNGLRVERAALRAGDRFSLGDAELRYEVTPPADPVGMTMIDSDADLQRSMDMEVLSMSLPDTGKTRLVVFSAGRTWEVPLDNTDKISIGRTDENDVLLEHDRVSRRHAEILRRGDKFVLRDLGSTNGTRLHGERVSEVTLENGDTFRIGDAHLAFKAAPGMEALTMIDESLGHGGERRPVVFVPGLFGSELWLGSERVWPNVKLLFRNPELYHYPSAVPLEPRAILDQVVVVPNLIKQDQYNRLGDYFVEELGYVRGRDFFEFPYDFRQDVRLSARQLKQVIDSLPTQRPVMLVAHSLGTLVSRYYVERLDGRRRVDRLVLMGGPHQGVVKSLTFVLTAPHLLPFGIMGETVRRGLATFPSYYQILPTYACGLDQNGRSINFMDEEHWVAEERRPLLRAAREFRKELGLKSSVPTLSIFGYGIKTISGVSLQQDGDGGWDRISFSADPSGDSSVLEKSAVLPNSEIHPVQQYHGSLFVDNDVKMRLKLELSRP